MAPARRVCFGCAEDRRRALFASWRGTEDGLFVLTPLHAAWDIWVLPCSESSWIVPALMTIWDRNVGIGVDVHVHHITNWLKWHNHLRNLPRRLGERMSNVHLFIGRLAPFSLTSLSVG